MFKCFNICKLFKKKNHNVSLIHIKKIQDVEFLHNEFIKIEEISKGGFGIIYKVTDNKKNVYILKKIINNSQNEISKYNIFDSSNIIKAYKIYKLYNNYILLHYYSFGDLLSQLILEDKYSEENTKIIIKKIIYPLLIFKKKRYVHQDIKLENYVIEKDLPLYSINNNLVLIDLGSIHKYKNIKKLYVSKCSVGTKKYASPEISDYNSYCSNSDVWSIGIMTYELLTGNTLNIYKLRKTESHIHNVLNIISVSALCKEFIISTLQPYNKRPEIDELYEHKWLK